MGGGAQSKRAAQCELVITEDHSNELDSLFFEKECPPMIGRRPLP